VSSAGAVFAAGLRPVGLDEDQEDDLHDRVGDLIPIAQVTTTVTWPAPAHEA
jgi:hypothetical protein